MPGIWWKISSSQLSRENFASKNFAKPIQDIIIIICENLGVGEGEEFLPRFYDDASCHRKFSEKPKDRWAPIFRMCKENNSGDLALIL